MKRTILFLFLSCTTVVCLAQSNCSIKKADAFITVSMPGMIFTDDKGNPVPPVPSLTRTIYLECIGTQMPVLDNILYNNIPQKTEITRIPGSKVIIGKHRENSRDYELTCRKGYTLWKIEVYPSGENKPVQQDCRHIIIKSRSGGRLCKFYIYRETELMSTPRY